jgi:hypothetical protein
MTQYFSIFFVACFVILSTTTNAVAETPDGFTPAEEAICDPLKADGITKGLYGLCVAFCEANDFASESNEITEDDLLALEDSAPSGKILQNYNKKKTEDDPDMPCIKLAEPCPCWSADELASVDGILPNGSTSNVFRYQFDGFDLSYAQEGWPELFVSARDAANQGTCAYQNLQVSPRISRVFTTNRGTLTHEQASNCRAQIKEHLNNLGYYSDY